MKKRWLLGFHYKLHLRCLYIHTTLHISTHATVYAHINPCYCICTYQPMPLYMHISTHATVYAHINPSYCICSRAEVGYSRPETLSSIKVGHSRGRHTSLLIPSLSRYPCLPVFLSSFPVWCLPVSLVVRLVCFPPASSGDLMTEARLTTAAKELQIIAFLGS